MDLAPRVQAALARHTFFDPCCMKAELYALLKGIGGLRFVGGAPRLALSTREVATLRKACALLKDLVDARFAFDAFHRPGIGGGRIYEATVDDPADVAASLDLFGGAGPFAATAATPAELTRRPCCRDAFLRGLFLASGYLADPARQYLLEFTFADRAHADFSARLLRSLGIRARLTARKRSLFIVYAKDAESLATFLARAGAVAELMEFENLRLVRSMRGDANRVTNFETANIGRTADAAGRLVAALQKARRAGRFALLTDDLRATVEARLRDPYAPLSTLGARLAPPVTKSTVAWRLRRAMAILEGERDEG